MLGCCQIETGNRIIDSIFGADGSVDVNVKGDSLYRRLKKYSTEPDCALDPSPHVNNLLSELVLYLQGGTDLWKLERECNFSTVEQYVCAKIDHDDVLSSKANAIRAVTVRAESRLELFWTRSLLATTTIVDPSLSSVAKIRLGAADFPYTENYISMVQTEARVILAELRSGFQTSRTDDGKTSTLSMAFCGSGPLPLTGLLLAVYTGCSVTLIDCDMEAVDLSRALIRNWELRGIIKTGQVKVLCSDGGKLRFFRGSQAYTHSGKTSLRSVQCDVLFIAALVPNATKEVIAENVCEMRDDGPLVVLRTAHGLTARLAYFQNRRHVMMKHLHFVGLVAPVVHHVGDGNIVDDVVKPMEFFSGDILNSLEMYRWRKKEEHRGSHREQLRLAN